MEKLHCSLCGGKMVPLAGTIEVVPVCPNCDMYPGMVEEMTSAERMIRQATASTKVLEWQRRNK